MIVADDLDTDELSRNPKRIKDAINWLNDGVLGTVDIGNQRFILVNNGPFANSILRSMVKEKLTGAMRMPISSVKRGCRAAGAFLYEHVFDSRLAPLIVVSAAATALAAALVPLLGLRASPENPLDPTI